MARTTITPVPVTRDGIDLPLVAAAATDLQFINTGKEVIFVDGTVDVSLVIAKQVDGVTVDPKVVSVVAGAVKAIGPFPTEIYNKPGGLMFFDLSTTTDVTIGVMAID